jgi:UDPglucose 6-dehydrogenase
VRVAVLGLWHLGSVTAACAAHVGHQVVGWDPSPDTVSRLQEGLPPLLEPGLAELVLEGLERGALSFTADLEKAVKDAEVVWITHDTPVDENDVADPASVISDIKAALPLTARGAVILI